jgi:hypothetical protein
LKQHLYACLFSNGIIKIGRSSSPVARIAQHEARLLVAGIDLIESHFGECIGSVLQAELALIRKCEAVHRSVKRGNEWFENLVFADVRQWVDNFCQQDFEQQPSDVVETYDPIVDSKLRQEIAVQIGLSEQYIYQCLTGRRNMKPIQASAIEKLTNGAINRKMVCRTTWQGIWPELVEARA